MTGYTDVRGPDGRLLFRFDPRRMVVEIVKRHVVYVVDLAAYMAASGPICLIDPPVGAAADYPLDIERTIVVD